MPVCLNQYKKAIIRSFSVNSVNFVNFRSRAWLAACDLDLYRHGETCGESWNDLWRGNLIDYYPFLLKSVVFTIFVKIVEI